MNCYENKKCHCLVCRPFSVCGQHDRLCRTAKTADDGTSDSENHHNNDSGTCESGEEDHDNDNRDSIGAGPFNAQQPAVYSSAGCGQFAGVLSHAAVGSNGVL